jgi:hypothetical protein
VWRASIVEDNQVGESRDHTDKIIAQLTQATSNLTDRLRKLVAPAAPVQSPEPAEASEDAAEGAARVWVQTLTAALSA